MMLVYVRAVFRQAVRETRIRAPSCRDWRRRYAKRVASPISLVSWCGTSTHGD
jgi:hypothetical protein